MFNIHTQKKEPATSPKLLCKTFSLDAMDDLRNANRYHICNSLLHCQLVPHPLQKKQNCQGIIRGDQGRPIIHFTPLIHSHFLSSQMFFHESHPPHRPSLFPFHSSLTLGPLRSSEALQAKVASDPHGSRGPLGYTHKEQFCILSSR